MMRFSTLLVLAVGILAGTVITTAIEQNNVFMVALALLVAVVAAYLFEENGE